MYTTSQVPARQQQQCTKRRPTNRIRQAAGAGGHSAALAINGLVLCRHILAPRRRTAH
eukprot:CAMPEP_0177463450 /NCGR_PEP_ID=MMETSP0369-20130122/16312_1 /TAXON_ID=447022 ORGANISM="Scrippsiella hangoei-like, Strain SHHI-4" /NCGR_SAMPLE_ID=MMETSP0369 /ASSEMBLY_ACC=CAM_ASM_000364 /LENGTH=57 /DNA_ID=CAMNT_0018937119 /DNA_START=585 /DNA_END=755 /DNA_ORIENTATION=-